MALFPVTIEKKKQKELKEKEEEKEKIIKKIKERAVKFNYQDYPEENLHHELLKRQLDPIYGHYRSTGDNLATIMLHIADVAFGGSTYFCSKGYEGSLSPEKGAALIWFNLKASGFADENQ